MYPVIPRKPKRADGKGRPRVKDKEVMEGILWVLRSGARWKDLPKEYPSYQTCHRRFQEWTKAGVFEKLMKKTIRRARKQGVIELDECFIDGSFSPAKKGHACG